MAVEIGAGRGRGGVGGVGGRLMLAVMMAFDVEARIRICDRRR
jgi:hypothetical protein